jgi:hypothetical protein
MPSPRAGILSIHGDEKKERSMTHAVRAMFPACLAIACSLPSHAATVTEQELPASVLACMSSASCFVMTTSSHESDTASAFPIFHLTGDGMEGNWLLRYPLVPPSGRTGIHPPRFEGHGGHLWLMVEGRYDASESRHPVTLYLDKVDPAPTPFYGQEGDLSLYVSTADLLAGDSHMTVGLGYGGSYGHGDLSGETPLPCLADGCRVHARLNLLQLSYAEAGPDLVFAGFNPSDSRGLLYRQEISYLTGDPFVDMHDVQAYYVSAVPLPAPAWLMGSGLLTLIGLGKRRHAHRRTD